MFYSFLCITNASYNKHLVNADLTEDLEQCPWWAGNNLWTELVDQMTI